jgi:hypothetical protein
VTASRITGKFPDIEVVNPGSFTLKRELIVAAAIRSITCGQAWACHLTAANERPQRLATATVPIINFALIGIVFFSVVVVVVVAVAVIVIVIAVSEGCQSVV